MRLVVLFSVAVLLAGCAGGIQGERYREQSPPLEMLDFFNGHIKAWGIVQNRSGNVVQKFTVDIHGERQGNLVVLNEEFHYIFGEGVTTRTWTIEKLPGDQYRGSATDIEAASGVNFGSALSWSYQMDLPVDDTSYRVGFDDWMWAFDRHTLMNRSYIKKFGLTMAEVTIFMQRVDD